MAQGVDVLVQVKGNQPEVLAACQGLAEHYAPADTYTEHDKGHGRIEEWATEVFVPPREWLPQEWAALMAAVIRVQRYTTRPAPNTTWHTTDDNAWYVCIALMPAPLFATAIRGHWGIENRQHHIRDVSSERVCLAGPSLDGGLLLFRLLVASRSSSSLTRVASSAICVHDCSTNAITASGPWS